MSDGPSIRDHRITKPYFRTCSTDKSRSLAPFYLCARCLIANQAEGTYWTPPLLFGRRPPQSNCPTETVRCPVSRESALELKHAKGGISRLAPPKLASQLQRLPPILHKTYHSPISAYSKGSRGLSVLVRVRGIFTTTTISPGHWLRQCFCRYAFHAGRNLPDKELRSVLLLPKQVIYLFSGPVISASLCMSPYSSDYIIIQHIVLDARRIVSEDPTR